MVLRPHPHRTLLFGDDGDLLGSDGATDGARTRTAATQPVGS